MSNLSNLYISASYYGVVNLSDATQPFTSQSEGRIYLHDGVGEPLGISLDYTKRVSLDNGLTVSGSTLLSGSVQILGDKEITGSLSVSGDITSGGTISGGTGSFDTINARKLNITIESSSVIYNSGSNIFGDEPTDTQILSGSVYVPNLHYLAGNPKDTNLRIDEKLFTSSFDSFSSSLHTEQLQQDQNLVNVSSSIDTTITNLSSSVDTSINNLSSSVDSTILAQSASFTISQGVQDGRLDSIEAFTSSLLTDFVTEIEYSASIAGITSSLENSIATKLNTGSYQIDSASFNNRIFNNGQNIASNYSDIQNIEAQLPTFATTGSNTFVGDNTFSGSVQGVVIPLTVTSQTASMDCSQGNFFTLTLPTGSDTHIIPTNIQPGLTITLQVKQDASDIGTVTFNPTKFDFPRLALPTITPQPNAKDILTFVSFDNQVLNGVISNDMI